MFMLYCLLILVSGGLFGFLVGQMVWSKRTFGGYVIYYTTYTGTSVSDTVVTLKQIPCQDLSWVVSNLWGIKVSPDLTEIRVWKDGIGDVTSLAFLLATMRGSV